MSHLLRLLILLSACDPQSPDLVPRVEHPLPAPTVSSSASAARMAEHFADSVKIKEAVIAGDLSGIRAPARRLLEPADASPEAWRPFITANAEFARAALAAKRLPGAAQAAAGLARTCGDCHAAMGAGPVFDLPHDTPAPAAHDVHKHMQRHQWAADRMWDALVSRSEYAWMVGAITLTDAPMERDDINVDVELPDDLFDLGGEVHALGALAVETAGWNARADVYGKILITCAGCHQGGC